ncbi:MLO-like protein 10 isoform X3 [Cryptomeria japonica]|uniref:MLO-like protein 10 isoform X3 n=1 Tax=Cryptomeria japonica TaxID=3369 RepID=UPI0027D9D563|nr:MLO-like protein 10 isoform X3 [Cryptomeria japonica]
MASDRSLEFTPTWAVALVCFVFILISVILEESIHHVGKEMVPLVSQGAMHQLHIFIFVLAIFQVLYSIITMGLGRAKMRRWKVWEKETETIEYQFSYDPSRFRLTHETSFVRLHAHFWNKIPIMIWIESFFRQFFNSVTKVDYLTLRHGFISAHLAPNSKFNFRKYISRSLEDDFKVVVGISPPLWVFAVIFLLLNVEGWQAYFWLSFIPLIIVLLVGTKLQVIITKMAVEIQARHAVVKGLPVVKPSNEHFWFGRPQLVLFLIHFVLFVNAFQLANFFWTWGKKIDHRKMEAMLLTYLKDQSTILVAVQFLCSYMTFPLYALVTQMGSNTKEAIFNEQTANAVKRWHKTAKKKKRQQESGSGGSAEASTQISSPVRFLRRFKTTGAFDRKGASERIYYSEHEMSDLEVDASLLNDERSIRSQTTKGKEKKEATEIVPTERDVDSDPDNTAFSFAKV